MALLAPTIATAAGAAGPVTVVGHSLGAALATYLALDLARGGLGTRVSACLFASPHTGNQAFVELFDKTITDYRLFNYILDVVPRVPLGLGYSPLPRRTVIQPATAEANIRVTIECNHHVICYCAMLDYEGNHAGHNPGPPGRSRQRHLHSRSRNRSSEAPLNSSLVPLPPASCLFDGLRFVTTAREK